MSCVDRTGEFAVLAESCRRALPAPVQTVRIRPRAAIAVQAGALAAQIKQAAALVTRLHQLARRRALFDDPAAEINELVPRIKSELQAANAGLAEFLTACSTQSGADPRKATAGTVACSPRTHWTLVAEILREKAVAVAGVLQDALTTRARNLQEHTSRRRQIARSNFVPTVQADSPLWAPMQFQTAQPQLDSALATAPGGARQGGLRSRRPGGFVVTPEPAPVTAVASSSSPARGGTPAAAPASDAVRRGGQTASGGMADRPSSLPGSRGPPAVLASGSSGTSSASPVQRRGGGGGAYSYTAQQVAQYHSASSRLDEQLAVETTIVEIGTRVRRRSGVGLLLSVLPALLRHRAHDDAHGHAGRGAGRDSGPHRRRHGCHVRAGARGSAPLP